MQVVYSKSFLKDVKRIRDKALLLRIERAILSIKEAENFDEIINELQIKKLVGASGYYRIRITNYRLGFEFSGKAINLIHFGHRKDFYEGFP